MTHRDTAPDFRTRHKQTWDVFGDTYSLWCWNGYCDQFDGPADCRVPCSCECHRRDDD